MNSPRLSFTSRRRSMLLDEDDLLFDDDSIKGVDVATMPSTTKKRKGGKDLAAAAELREACILFAIVGVGYLFPFSALTQPVDYWSLLFPDKNIEFPLTTIYMYTNLFVLTLLVFGTTTNTLASGGGDSRIVNGFVGQFLVLVFVPTSYFFNLDEDSNERAILGATMVAAIVTAFIDSSVIALAVQYPVRVQESFQFGVGLSTLIGSIYRDVTKLLFPPEMVVASSLLYFYSGAITIALCIVAYHRLMRLDLSKRCFARATAAATTISTKSTTKQVEHDTHVGDTTLSNETSQLLASSSSPSRSDKWVVLNKILFNEAMVFLLFFSTLALWPPLVTEIPSYNFPRLESTGWWSLILLTVFSVCDCTGRLLVRFRAGLTRHNVWIPVLLRLVLVPLILASVKGVIFTNDVWSVVFVGVLGITNGYVGTLSIILVNESCDDSEEEEVAGTFTGFFLNSGLVFGASLGLLLEKIAL